MVWYDKDGDGITYAVSGSELTINPSSGALTFVSAPDYETKATYTTTVTATNNGNNLIIEFSDDPEYPEYYSRTTLTDPCE